MQKNLFIDFVKDYKVKIWLKSFIDLNLCRVIKDERFFIFFLNLGYDEVYFNGLVLKNIQNKFYLKNYSDKILLRFLYFCPSLIFYFIC